MRKLQGKAVFSASDLVNFLECEHLTTLDLRDLDAPLPRAEDDEQAKLIQKKGFEHERGYLNRLRDAGIEVTDIKALSSGTESAIEETHKAMRSGAEMIYQACLAGPDFVGWVDFLRRTSGASRYGNYSYEVLDTKLSRTAKAKFVIQLCLYSDLLARTQEVMPQYIYVVLGGGNEQRFRLANYLRYYKTVKARFLERARAGAVETYPVRCAHCALCAWRLICGAQWEKDDHLNQVANIRRTQIDKLAKSGITTLTALARAKPGRKVPGMQPATFEKLRRQAALQLAKRETGQSRFELLETNPGETRGFRRLPEPDPGDIFFDLEGDPLEEDGLQYLFGVCCCDHGGLAYKEFWAHDRKGERVAFERFMAFVMKRLKRYPRMHIYHYGSYEETALKRLMSLHGTCEAEVDHLLRAAKLVDLCKVVREAILVSEPGYSIKDLETFYMEERQGEVTDAGASLVYYDYWRETGDSKLLDKIRSYNADDCRSTALLRDWLIGIRPPGEPWFTGRTEGEERKSDLVRRAEARLAEYRERLLGGLPANKTTWGEEGRVRELIFQLLDFQRRAAKPAWWAMFSRHEMTEEELIDDPESIGGLEAVAGHHPESDKRSFIYTFTYPEQEFKLQPGNRCLRADTLEPAGTIEELDEAKRVIKIRLGRQSGTLPERLSIIPTGPIKTTVLTEAVYRLADSIIDGDDKYGALRAILHRQRPVIRGLEADEAIVAGDGDLTKRVIEVVSRLDSSYLFVQGPPGAGKTRTAAHVIVALVAGKRRVGVSSNSHKAINNLLHAVERVAEQEGVELRGAKKSSDPDTFFNGNQIANYTRSLDVIASGADMLAGTAWFFAHPGLDQELDYLFVDEAGQVSLGNLVAMGTSARNIVLLGDQMQLQQPIQGVHPGSSGDSALDYLLQGQATIAEDRGVFLGTTWRMHGDVCRFISEAVYDGRLYPEADNQRQRLVLSASAHAELRPAGVRFVKVEHDGRSQRSEEEAQVVRALYESLLAQSFVDRRGKRRRMSTDNILVVAPYNMQVHLLKQTLPAVARVGTVDKFQGQEAEVVIVSMTTSSGEYLPRFMEFLYSKNRLNVALSRARCLALLVASPALMTIKCNSIEQMELVNTLCWVDEYAGQLSN